MNIVPYRAIPGTLISRRMARGPRIASTLMFLGLWWLPLSLLLTLASAAAEHSFTVRDTLETSAVEGDVGTALAGLRWTPTEFAATWEPAVEPDEPVAIRFPSPIDTGDPINDRVALMWYRAVRPAEEPDQPRPAIVVVHESGSAMPVGKLFARAFAAHGAESFLIQLPSYGLRRREGTRPTGEGFLVAMRQAIADVRRARDVVAAFPQTRVDKISLQGTSLGGFVAATVAGVDRGFDSVFIMLAGGDLVSLVLKGEKEAAELRERLARAGYTGEKLTELLEVIEPTRLASRIDPATTWLYSAEQDRVVPLANALALKAAGNIPDDHHIRLWGDHTSTAVFLPVIIRHVMERVGGKANSE